MAQVLLNYCKIFGSETLAVVATGEGIRAAQSLALSQHTVQPGMWGAPKVLTKNYVNLILQPVLRSRSVFYRLWFFSAGCDFNKKYR